MMGKKNSVLIHKNRSSTICGHSVEICNVKPIGTRVKTILYTHETPFTMAHISQDRTQNNGQFIGLRLAASL